MNPLLRKMGTFFRLLRAKHTRRELLYTLLYRLNIREVLTLVRSHKLWLNLSDTTLGRWLFIYQDYEPFEYDLFTSSIKTGDTILIGGANIGYYTLAASLATGPRGRVLSFEPEANNFRLLQKNIAYQALGNVTAEQLALMSSADGAFLFRATENLSNHRTSPYQHYALDESLSGESIPIRSVTADAYLEQRGLHADVIKLDIEGAEFEALSGMSNQLLNPRLILFIEFWPKGLRAGGIEPSTLLDLLQKHRLTIFEIHEDRMHLSAVDLRELANRFSDEGVTNLLCLGSERRLKPTKSEGLEII